ncbi:MAG: phosphotransferase [Cyclobacteriaceae bacterium]|nr:phosphotransferase [Cyclobacteriaceae bacterium]
MDHARLKSRFHSFYPDKFFLEYSVSGVNEYLSGKNWLLDNENVTGLEKPGEGNMNLVLRVKTNIRSFILKQARPWVEKYPHIPAPVERNHVETEYYLIISKDKILHAFSPEVLGYDKDNFMVMYNDLGDSVDFSYLYKNGNRLLPDEKKDLLGYVSALHHFDSPAFPFNGSMRELNHEYIFRIPFQEDNGIDLDAVQPGLKTASLPYTENLPLRKAIGQLGKYYLMEGPVLIHGDFFPGSWLKSGSGIKIIDPEFGFKGYGEFDLGVMIAHMLMAGQGMEMVESILEDYDPPAGFDPRLLAGFAGTEVLRRILGVAQLPLALSLEDRINLMKSAEEWIMTKKIELL